MPFFSRRSFLAASAAMSAAPALAQPGGTNLQPLPKQRSTSRPDGVDAIIIGAGAAGIAAARRLVAAGRRVAIVEAVPEIGGRCVTDTKIFGVPYDRGAHWIHMPDINPVAKLATQTGLDIYPAPPGQRIRVGRRFARESEMEDFLATQVRATTAIADAARKGDVACSQALPKDLGEWRSTIEFFLGPFGCGKDLSEISALDFSRSSERDIDAFCRQGFGTLVTKLAAGLPVQLNNPVTAIEWGRRTAVEVVTARGRLTAPAAIVTASTNVLAARKIKFDPELPRRQLDALFKLKLGSYDHVTLELPGNPLGLRTDELVLEKSNGPRTASIFANASGSTLCMIDVGGSFGRDLADKGEKEMVAFALDWLTNLFGSDMKTVVQRRHATRWNEEPWVLGAFSAALPGGQSARRVLMEPLNRMYFAGEAVHETLWGTVGGAWESGERAADAVLRLFGGRR
jgi:monoamine oxidase